MTRSAAALGVAAALAAATSCWTAPRAPDGTAAIPGTVWATPGKPFRYAGWIVAVALDAPHGAAMLALGRGDILRVDLATGRTILQRAVPDLAPTALLHLADGRWLVAGTDHGAFAAVTLDDDTLAPTPVPVRGRYALAGNPTKLAQLADGRVVMSGEGIRFAAYDPRTWRTAGAIKTLVSVEPWSCDGRAVYYRGEGGKAVRDPLDGHGAQPIGGDAIPLAAGGGVAARIVTIPGAGGTKTRVTEILGAAPARTLPLDGTGLSLSPDGRSLALVADDHLRVVSPADGQRLADVALPVHAPAGSRIAIAATHAAIATGSQLTIVDLRAGTVTADAGGPHGSPAQLAVARDGRVLAIDDRAWRLDGHGAHGGAAPFASTALATGAPGEVDRIGLVVREPEHAVELRDVDTGAVRTRLEMDVLPGSAWVAGDRVIATSLVSPATLWHVVDGKLASALNLNDNAFVEDADPAADLALVSLGGVANVVDLHTAAAVGEGMPFPSCDIYGNALLERGGHRVATHAGRDVYVWDRGRGELEGSLRAPESLEAGEVHFVPGRDEVIVEGHAALALWSLGDHTLRTLATGSAMTLALSTDGKRLALAMSDGRAALVDLDALRAALPATPAEPADDPASCAGGEVVTAPPAPEPEPCPGYPMGD